MKLSILIFSLISSVGQVGAIGICKFAEMFPNRSEKCYQCDTKSYSSSTSDSTVPTSLDNSTGTSSSPGSNAFPSHALSKTYLNSRISSKQPHTSPATLSTMPYVVSTTPSCPPNMVYDNCSNCQATCEQPKINDECYRSCVEGCVCANGFILQGQDACMSPKECACFVSEGFVLADGTQDYVNEDCTQQCNCSNGQLHCDFNYKCDHRAICKLRDGARRCYCVDGHAGDGKTCIPFSDCADAFVSGHTEDGVHQILPVGWSGQPFNVSCDMTTKGGGWTVFQRRLDDTLSFYRNWQEYKIGFGNLDGNFWLGNEKLFYLTNQKNYELRIEIHGSSLGTTNASYSLFRIGSEANNYILSELGEFSGNIGHDYMDFHHGGYFNTFDNDNDDEPNQNCALQYKGGWWYKDCYDANLNGVFGLPDNDWAGIALYNRATKDAIFGITFVEMKLKEISD